MFSYQEALTIKGLKNLPLSLKINDKSSSLLLIFRLLSGNINVNRNIDDRNLKQRKNFFVVSNDPHETSTFGDTWTDKFPKLFGEDLEIEDIEKYFSHYHSKINEHFYSDVLNELSSFFIQSNKKSNTSAFIHLYRTLEYISYAFPMIYASKADNFRGTFQHLKDWFSQSKDGKSELKFFETFTNKIFQKDEIVDVALFINILGETPEFSSVLYQTLEKAVPKDGLVAEECISGNRLAIKFTNFGGFIICLRNYFMHYLNIEGANYHVKDFIDSDRLFFHVNPVIVTWISIIILEINKYSLTQYHSLNSA